MFPLDDLSWRRVVEMNMTFLAYGETNLSICSAG